MDAQSLPKVKMPNREVRSSSGVEAWDTEASGLPLRTSIFYKIDPELVDLANPHST